MKRINTYLLVLLGLFIISIETVSAQKDSVTSEEVVKLKYYNTNNSVQYLIIESVLKTGKKLTPLKNKSYNLYLDSISTEKLIAKVNTDETGKAKSFLPIILKQAWDANPQHKFIAVTAGTENSVTEIEVTKAKINIDTSSTDELKSIIVQVLKYENSEWVPVSDVEMKVGYQRLGSILSAGDEATYTTDSTGSVTVEVTKTNLPGDSKGNIILVAKVEDNDIVGNLLVEKSAPWGTVTKPSLGFFNQRTLWSTRFKTPVWLLFMAYSIILTVWGTLVYLVFQLIRIKKLGKQGS